MHDWNFRRVSDVLGRYMYGKEEKHEYKGVSLNVVRNC